jgi:hypothetical protein
MNTEKRQKLEQAVKNQRVMLFLQTEKESWGLTEKEEVLLSVSELSDLELASLASSLKWGNKQGLLSEGVDSRSISFEA